METRLIVLELDSWTALRLYCIAKRHGLSTGQLLAQACDAIVAESDREPKKPPRRRRRR